MILSHTICSAFYIKTFQMITQNNPLAECEKPPNIPRKHLERIPNSEYTKRWKDEWQTKYGNMVG